VNLVKGISLNIFSRYCNYLFY